MVLLTIAYRDAGAALAVALTWLWLWLEQLAWPWHDLDCEKGLGLGPGPGPGLGGCIQSIQCYGQLQHVGPRCSVLVMRESERG